MKEIVFPALTFDADLNTIVLLGPPEGSTLKDADVNLLLETANSFFAMWLELLSSDLELPERIHAKCPGCDYELELTGEEVWDRLLLCIAVYYDFCLQSLFSAQDSSQQQSVSGHKVSEMRDLLKLRKSFDESPVEKKEWGWNLSYHYLLGMFAYSTMQMVQRAGVIPDSRSYTFEDMFHTVIAKMHYSEISAVTDNQKILSTRLLHSLLHNSISYYDLKADAQNEMDIGPFSLIQHSELHGLASRDQSLIRRYGSKAIETIFEYQLALIVQSLGFYVLRTRKGERTVDLLCVSGDPGESITILIEAKTSTKAYSLPTKDERALSEYIKTVTSHIAPLPAVKYVLILGHKASKTLGDKLQRLESTSQIPIRFSTAKDFALLREQLPGPAPIGVLTRRILAGPHILPEGWTSDVSAQFDSIQSNLVRLMRTMLPPHDLRHSEIGTWETH